MSIKLFAGLLIVLLGSVFGSLCGNKSKKRRDFFISLESFIVQLRREISFSSAPISEIFISCSSENEYLKNMLLTGDERYNFPDFLTENERTFIKLFFDKLGHSDRNNEVELIASFLEDVKKYRNEEVENCKRRTALYTKLGFFAGLAVFVVIM